MTSPSLVLSVINTVLDRNGKDRDLALIDLAQCFVAVAGHTSAGFIRARPLEPTRAPKPDPEPVCPDPLDDV
jgi:hypothetical protein